MGNYKFIALFIAVFFTQLFLINAVNADDISSNIEDCANDPIRPAGGTLPHDPTDRRLETENASAVSGQIQNPGVVPGGSDATSNQSSFTGTQSILNQLHTSSTPESRVQEAQTTPIQNAQAASRDAQILNREYQSQSQTQLLTSLQRSQQSLASAIQNLSQSQAQVAGSDSMRQLAQLRNAQDMVQYQQQRLQDPSQPWLKTNQTPAQYVFNNNGANAGQSQNMDTLLQRLIQLQGLPKEKQDQLAGQLSMVEPMQLLSKDGSRMQLPMVHNGEAAPSGPIDCFSTYAQMLSAESRRGSLSVLDLQAIYNLGNNGAIAGHGANPVQYKSPARERFVRRMSVALSPVKVEKGAKSVKAGDLLVYRVKNSPVSKVLIVRTYDPRSGQARVIESDSARGPIRERDVNLGSEQAGADTVGIAAAGKAGVFGLRLHPNTSVCTAAVEIREGASKIRPSGRPKF